MTNDPNRRRRFAAGYVLSLVVHGLAVIVFFFASVDISADTIARLAPADDVTVVRQESPAVAESPVAVRPQTPLPQNPPVLPNRVRPRPRALPIASPVSVLVRPLAPVAARAGLRPSLPPSPQRRPELARMVVGAEPQAGSPIPLDAVPSRLRAFAPVALAVPTVEPAASAPPAPPIPLPVPSPIATALPTAAPTVTPAPVPTAMPTAVPTAMTTAAPPTAEPTAAPTRVPTAAPTVAPTAASTVIPTAAPTAAPTVAPTAAPTVAPTVAPTAAPTVIPTAAPTVLPTAAPMKAPTAAPTVEPRQPPTSAPTGQPTPAPAAKVPSAAPTEMPHRPAAASPVPSPARVSSNAAQTPAPARHPTGAPRPPSGTPATAARVVAGSVGNLTARASGSQQNGSPEPAREGSQSPNAVSPSSSGSPAPAANRALTSLNDRLKALSVGGDVDYSAKRVKIGDAQSVMDSAMAAYEATLAPPADILRRTFGLMYERRSAGHPDSIAYVFDSYTIGPIRMCKAWKIIEHPYQPVAETGAVSHNAGIGGGVVSSANSPVIRHDNGGLAEATIVQFPCSQKSYTSVPPGSVTTPVPRHPDLRRGPEPSPSLAP